MSNKYNVAAINSTSEDQSASVLAGPLRPSDFDRAYLNFKTASELLTQVMDFANYIAGPAMTNKVVHNTAEDIHLVTVNITNGENLTGGQVQTLAAASGSVVPVIKLKQAVSRPLTLNTKETNVAPQSVLLQGGVTYDITSSSLTYAELEPMAAKVMDVPLTLIVGPRSKPITERTFEMPYSFFLESVFDDLVSTAMDVQQNLHSRLAATQGSSGDIRKNLIRYNPERFAKAYDRIEVLRTPQGDPILQTIGYPGGEAQKITELVTELAAFEQFV